MKRTLRIIINLVDIFVRLPRVVILSRNYVHTTMNKQHSSPACLCPVPSFPRVPASHTISSYDVSIGNLSLPYIMPVRSADLVSYCQNNGQINIVSMTNISLSVIQSVNIIVIYCYILRRVRFSRLYNPAIQSVKFPAKVETEQKLWLLIRQIHIKIKITHKNYTSLLI